MEGGSASGLRGVFCIQRGGLHRGGLHRGGGGLHGGVCIQGRADLPLGILRDMVNKQAVRILLECVLVFRIVLCT